MKKIDPEMKAIITLAAWLVISISLVILGFFATIESADSSPVGIAKIDTGSSSVG